MSFWTCSYAATLGLTASHWPWRVGDICHGNSIVSDCQHTKNMQNSSRSCQGLSRSEGTQASNQELDQEAQKQRIGFVLANAEREPQLKRMLPHRAQACSSWSKIKHPRNSTYFPHRHTYHNFIQLHCIYVADRVHIHRCDWKPSRRLCWL